MDSIRKLDFRSRNAKPELEILSLHQLTQQRRESLSKPHRTSFYHLLLLENGHPVHWVDFEQFPLQPGSLLFIDKERVHQFDVNQPYYGNLLVFTDSFFTDVSLLRKSALFNDVGNRNSVVADGPAFFRMMQLCAAMKEELQTSGDEFQPGILSNHLSAMLLLAEREKLKVTQVLPGNRTDLEYLLKFRDLLESQYTSTHAVKEYAQQLGISEKRLAQATQSVVGRAPKLLIAERTILEARRLLVHSQFSIKEISWQLGFEDPAYFIRFFKKNTQATPLEFRQKYIASARQPY